MKKKKVPWSIIYLVATIVVIIIFIIANNQTENVIKALMGLDVVYVLIAILSIVLFWMCEGGILFYLLRSLKEKVRIMSCIKIGFIGMYYSAITPSATGGQPAQVAYFKRDDGVNVGSSVASIFVKFFSYQVAFVICTIVSFIFMNGSMSTHSPHLIPFVYLGIAINSVWICAIPLLFSEKILRRLANFFVKIINKFKFFKKKEKHINTIRKFENDFAEYTGRFKKNKKSILIAILLSFVQVLFQMAVLFFIFYAFGNKEFDFVTITAMQVILQSSVCFMPMPGASGAQEIGFTAFFNGFFSAEQILPAVMIWRFFTYYLIVVSGALLVVVDEVIYRRKKKKLVQNND